MNDRRDGMLRRAARLVARLTWRHVEVRGAHHLAAPGPALVVANHFGGVADAVLVVLASPRRPRIVAADRLWRIPLLGRVLDAIGAIPIHQRRDGPGGNDAAFASCDAALAEGDLVLIFPEGITREEPSIGPVKTGAARIALSAAARGVEGVRIVPLGIHYEDKAGFRSDVYVEVDEPFAVDGVLAPGADPGDRASVEALTAEVDRRLRRAAPDFRDWPQERALRTAAEVALRDLAPDPRPPVPLDLGFRVADAAARLPETRLTPLVGAGGDYRDLLAAVETTDRAVAAARPGAARLGGRVAREGLLALLLLPYAAAGLVANAVPLALLALIRRVVRAPAVMATILPLAATVLFGLTWTAWLWLAAERGGRHALVVTAILLPALLAALLMEAERLALAGRGLAGLVRARGRDAAGLRAARDSVLLAWRGRR